MPLAPAQPDAVANVYARSLYELAEAQGGPTEVESTLGQLEDILELARSNPDFAEFLSSRILSERQREGSLRKILTGRVSDLVLRFMLVLNEKDRLSHLPPITASLDAIVQEAFGRVEIDVFTPAPLDASQINDIRNRLARALGKEVILHPYTEPKMIGGVKLRIGDRLIDGSLASSLRRVRDQLNNSGAATIRSRAASMIDRNT